MFEVRPISATHIEFHTPQGLTIAHSQEAAEKLAAARGMTLEEIAESMTPAEVVPLQLMTTRPSSDPVNMDALRVAGEGSAAAEYPPVREPDGNYDRTGETYRRPRPL